MMHDRKVARGEQLSIRIGIHVGDVVERGNDILGDAVNIASRIESLAVPGGICISSEVYNQVRNKLDVPLVSLGEKLLKNVEMPVEVYKVVMPWELSTRTEESSFPTNRVAILPFTSFSSNPDDAYFADGVTDEIISAVAGISGLSVISRTSVVGYKGTTKKVKEIGKELEVGSILEGTFKKAGNRIRVTTQLIDVAADKHLWAQNYDRELDDVFEVQSDVAKQVADALRVRILSPEVARIEKKPTQSTAAYTLYLKGRYLWNKRNPDDLKKARECFEQAVKEDPGFALAYAGQADCSLILRQWNVDLEANLERAKAMVTKALELNPELAEAHTTKGLLSASEYNLRQAEEEYKRAIELKPSYATAHQWYFWVLFYQLRWDEALEQIEKALELDPLSPIINQNHGDFYFSRKDFGKALESYRRAAELGMVGGRGGMASCYGMMKMYDDMRREAATAVELLQSTYPLIKTSTDAWEAYFEGDKDTVRRLLPELQANLQETMSSAYSIACFCFYLGENDKGFEWLERAYDRREDTLLGVKNDWDLDGVRTDPRYLTS
jgi:TolB-like protein/TPR repeat protein